MAKKKKIPPRTCPYVVAQHPRNPYVTCMEELGPGEDYCPKHQEIVERTLARILPRLGSQK